MNDEKIARLRSHARSYGLTILALVAAALLTIALIHFHLPILIASYAFLFVIMGAAWWGGFGPGILATLATLLLAPYLTQPGYSVRHPTLSNAPMILIISVLISWMAGARRKLGEANELLDERVRQRTTELELVNQALKEREAMLIAQAERLSQSNADLEQFAYFASHDLQEPLRMIGIYSELQQQLHAATADEKSTMYANVIRDSVRRMDTLIQDLLSYARAIHDEKLEKAEIDPRDALEVVTTNLKSQLEEKRAELAIAELPRVLAEPVQLIQIFQNLIGNSLKYRSAEDPRISVQATRGENEWIFSVKDNGIGISPDYHERIFAPFKRLHAQQQIPGSGVGLAISRRIVERLGGRIWVESEIGRGATFFFTIPFVTRDEHQPSEVQTHVSAG